MAQLTTPTITPFLWFDTQAEDAAIHYTSIFPDSQIDHVGRGPGGKVFSVKFTLSGQRFFGMNGGPMYSFTPAISLFVSCEDQPEVDFYWNKLVEGGKPSRCGWLVDKFGLSWQVIPKALGELMGDPNPQKAGAVVQAMMKMEKIDVAALYAAHASA